MLISGENISYIYHNKGLSNHVLENISLSIEEGETVGILGKSGCGKSTLGQILCGLRKPTAGKVIYRGEELAYPLKRQTRKEIQMLFQHPESSFNPRLTIYQSLKEVYKLYGLPFSDGALLEMLEDFGIYEEHLHRFPIQLSGGELQRIATSRVLLAKPRLIVLDEPTSMLDSISQAQIMRMLLDIQKRIGIGYLFISHNELLCETVCNRVFTIEEKRIKKRI